MGKIVFICLLFACIPSLVNSAPPDTTQPQEDIMAPYPDQKDIITPYSDQKDIITPYPNQKDIMAPSPNQKDIMAPSSDQHYPDPDDPLYKR